MWETLAVAAEELGRVPVDVPFLTSSVIAATITRRIGQPALASELLRGATTAAFLTPFHEPFRLTSAGRFHDGRVWADVPAVAGATGAQMMLILCGDKLIGLDREWAELSAAGSIDATRDLADVSVRGAYGCVLAEGDTALHAISAAADAGCAILSVEQAALAHACTERLDGTGAGSDPVQRERHTVGLDRATHAARYAVQCLATDDAHTAVAVSTARMVCSTVSFRAAAALASSRQSGCGSTTRLIERARGNAVAFGGPVWHRRRLAQLMTPPVPDKKFSPLGECFDVITDN